MWSIVNKETGRAVRDKTDFTELLQQNNGQSFQNKKDVVDFLNDTFLTAGAQAGAPPVCLNSSITYLSSAIQYNMISIRLKPFTCDEVLKIINSDLSPKTTTDLYDLSVTLLRKVSHVLASPLSKLFSQCLKNGSYPSALKKVKIVPIYKGKGDKALAKNYRPISIIPAAAKVLEVGLNKRLLEFLTNCDIFTDRQYAYRAGRSTTGLVREFVRQVLQAREDKLQVAAICCDLSRAFDTADRSLIRAKLEHYGVRGPAEKLMADFVTERCQRVFGDSGRVRSEEGVPDLGVPQGSCLSNTTFALLMNDLPKSINNAEVYMFADDVAALVSAPSFPELSTKLTEVALQLEKWFSVNGFALNLDKTCCIHFNLANRPQQALAVAVRNVALQQVPSVKLLGFHVDRALKWNAHIDAVCARLSQACFALSRVAVSAPRDAVLSCYFATVHSVLMYGTELWGSAADSERPLILQKRAVRTIVRVKWDVSAKPYFTELGILTVPSIYIYQVCTFVRLNLDKFDRLGATHTYNTRQKDKLKTPAHSLAKSVKSVYICGASIYNHLPESIRNAASFNIFKYKLKIFLQSRAYYDVTEYLAEKFISTSSVP